MKKIKFLLIFLPFQTTFLAAQAPQESLFRSVEINTDTLTFTSTRNTVNFNDERNLCFLYDDERCRVSAGLEIKLFAVDYFS